MTDTYNNSTVADNDDKAMPFYRIGDVAPPPYIRQLIKMEAEAGIRVAEEFLSGATVVSHNMASTLTDRLIGSNHSARTTILASTYLQLKANRKPDEEIPKTLQGTVCTGAFHHAVHVTNIVRRALKGAELSPRDLIHLAEVSGKPILVL